jgi:hypothetical protein
MDDREHEFWGQLVTLLGLPQELREHIETRATREGLSPWDYILDVLRRDAQQAHGSGGSGVSGTSTDRGIP